MALLCAQSMRICKMSKISGLEKQKIADAYRRLALAKKSHTKNEDSINDFLYEQFQIETEEKETLDSAREHFKIELEVMLEVFDIVDLLVEHFEI